MDTIRGIGTRFRAWSAGKGGTAGQAPAGEQQQQQDVGQYRAPDGRSASASDAAEIASIPTSLLDEEQKKFLMALPPEFREEALEQMQAEAMAQSKAMQAAVADTPGAGPGDGGAPPSGQVAQQAAQQAAQPAAAARVAPSGAGLVGLAVSILWRGKDAGDRWFSGTVARFDEARGLHFVRYDDGDEQWYDLRAVKYKILTPGYEGLEESSPPADDLGSAAAATAAAGAPVAAVPAAAAPAPAQHEQLIQVSATPVQPTPVDAGLLGITQAASAVTVAGMLLALRPQRPPPSTALQHAIYHRPCQLLLFLPTVLPTSSALTPIAVLISTPAADLRPCLPCVPRHGGEII